MDSSYASGQFEIINDYLIIKERYNLNAHYDKLNVIFPLLSNTFLSKRPSTHYTNRYLCRFDQF